ncbi:MAG: diaminopimelate decarboxylase [Magnetococcales bacterium]|nr:diaminopimelate decarboxylase [Magnetococcales bacterium]
MDYFHYLGDRLHCEETGLDRIAEAVGTPFYCYSERTILRHLEAFERAFQEVDHRICYSVKANGNLAVLDTLVRGGAGLDIVSGGELERARRVGCPGDRIVFSGVGKTAVEINAALDHGLLMFNVESLPELHRINTVAGVTGRVAPVALRINPDVDPRTHPHISTGLRRNKFGIPHGQALEVYRLAMGLPHVQVVGLDCHIGSQLTELEPFVDALRRVKGLLGALREAGIPIRYLDLGGGLGIPYGQGEAPPSPEQLARALLAELQGLELAIILEPGRAIVGNAGVLVARVIYSKEGEEKRFVITDAGMNDLLRPSLYSAYHTILPVERHFDREEAVADVVGPICESGDFLARDRLLPVFREGDLLAVRSAGAYGFSMSSNYNTRPRAAEVMVRGEHFAVVRRRETLDQLLENETLFPEKAGVTPT